MNDFELTIMDAERAAEFEAIFGSATVPVLSPFPRWCNLNGHGEELVYMLNFEAITADQQTRLVEHLAQKFGATPADVWGAVRALGMPIMADSTTLTVMGNPYWASVLRGRSDAQTD